MKLKAVSSSEAQEKFQCKRIPLMTELVRLHLFHGVEIKVSSFFLITRFLLIIYNSVINADYTRGLKLELSEIYDGFFYYLH